MPLSAPFTPLPVSHAARKRACEVGLPAYLQHDFYATYFAARAEKLFHVQSRR